jgi:hypothetical protein
LNIEITPAKPGRQQSANTQEPGKTERLVFAYSMLSFVAALWAALP